MLKRYERDRQKENISETSSRNFEIHQFKILTESILVISESQLMKRERYLAEN